MKLTASLSAVLFVLVGASFASGAAVEKRLLFQSGKQSGSADGYGGLAHLGQTNAPVVSGSGNSVTTGGTQAAEANGTGGSVQQTLTQTAKLFGLTRREASDPIDAVLTTLTSLAEKITHLGSVSLPGGSNAESIIKLPGMAKRRRSSVIQEQKRLLSAMAKQQATADATGGKTEECQVNKPVVSGSGNSVTVAGAQQADASAKGGSIVQSISQSLGLRHLHHRRHSSQA